MKIFIVGGTGFLGYYATKLFLDKGHQVDTLSIPDIPLGDWFPNERVGVQYGDVFSMDSGQLVKLFQGYDALVYAVGPDDRILAPSPAYDFFHERLVEACSRVVQAAKDAGVKRCTICGSYFAYFDRVWPELNLAQRHPYIKCRVAQAERCLALSDDNMAVMILELPYIFGTMPERVPIWKDILLTRLQKMPGAIYFFKGGSVMMTVEQVAQCIVGSIEQGQAGKRYPCGDENVSWDTWLSWIQEAAGMNKRIVHIPSFLGTLYGASLRRKELKQGKEGGLNYKYLFNDIQSRYLYYGNFDDCEELGMTRSGVKESVIDTIRACVNS